MCPRTDLAPRMHCMDDRRSAKTKPAYGLLSCRDGQILEARSTLILLSRDRLRTCAMITRTRICISHNYVNKKQLNLLCIDVLFILKPHWKK